jgi:hypothetical protein
MAPDRMGGLAYWASGGTVASRRGPLGPARAAELLGFFNLQADACVAEGDAGVARFCADLALELGCAVAAAVTWRKCASA